MKLLRYIYVILALTPLLMSCSQEEEPANAAQGVNLRIRFTQPAPTSRATLLDPDNTNSVMTEWEQYVDGQKLYHLFILLLNSDGNMVAYRDIHKDGGGDYTNNDANYKNNLISDDGQEAEVNFVYNHPLAITNAHGTVEQLKQGKYTLIVVANYSGIGADGKTYGGNSDVNGYISAIETAFGTNRTAPLTAGTDFSNLLNYKIAAGNDFVCPQEPQMLTLMKEITLSPGDNTISGELIRTYSRIRIEAENHSNYVLTLSNLSFSTNFAQKEAYLFENNANRYTGITKGQPNVTSPEAITQFTATSATIEANGSSKAIFDAYILESKDEANRYSYTLTAEYVGHYYPSYRLDDLTPVTSIEDNGRYVIQSYKKKYNFITKGTNEVELTNSSSISNVQTLIANNDQTHVWYFESTGTADQYYICSALYPYYYIGNVERDKKITLSGSPIAYNVSQRSGTQTNQFSFESQQGLNDSYQFRYLNTYDYDESIQKIAGWSYNRNDDGDFFSLYKLDQTNETPVKANKTCIISTIDPNTAEVTLLTNIRRNDFIRSYIKVTYVDQLQDFTFEVKPWVKKNEDITFN